MYVHGMAMGYSNSVILFAVLFVSLKNTREHESNTYGNDTHERKKKSFFFFRSCQFSQMHDGHRVLLVEKFFFEILFARWNVNRVKIVHKMKKKS